MPASSPHHAPLPRSASQQILRFCLTGFLATAIHFCVVVILVRGGGESVAPLANVAAFWVATGVSFFLNTRWSFGQLPKPLIAARYISVSLLCSSLAFLISKLAHLAAIDYRAGVLLVVLLVTPTSFVLHRSWTYRSPSIHPRS